MSISKRNEKIIQEKNSFPFNVVENWRIPSIKGYQWWNFRMEYDRSLFTCHRSKQWLLSDYFRSWTDWPLNVETGRSPVESYQRENLLRAGRPCQSSSSFLGQSTPVTWTSDLMADVACSLDSELKQSLSSTSL